MNADPLYTVDIFACPAFHMLDFQDCHRAHNIRVQRSFEPMSMKIWCDFARTATGIIDIGAQVGVYSLAAASLRKDIPIHAFEPNPDAYARLALHRRINGFDNIVCHREGIADRESAAIIQWVKKGELISSGGHLANAPNVIGNESALCRTARLDSFGLALGPRGLIKIDVEGAESYVLQGMTHTLEQQPTIILETFSQASCDAWNDAIKPLGYKIHKILEHDGDMIEVDKLTPCDRTSGDFNHLLYVPYICGELDEGI